MVGGARGLTPEQVTKMLNGIREAYGKDVEYRKLRSRLPEDFPL